MDSVLLEHIPVDAVLTVEEDVYLERPDVCDRAIYIVGNRRGFMALMHCILYDWSELVSEIDVTKLPFVTSKLSKPFVIEVDDSWERDIHNENGIVEETDQRYTWYLNEANLAMVASNLHSVGMNPNILHIHFDPKKNKSRFAVFCTI